MSCVLQFLESIGAVPSARLLVDESRYKLSVRWSCLPERMAFLMRKLRAEEWHRGRERERESTRSRQWNWEVERERGKRVYIGCVGNQFSLVSHAVAQCGKQCRQERFEVPWLVQPGRMLWHCRRLSGALPRCLVVRTKYVR